MAHVCAVCKATEFEETEDGALSCVECGTQIFGVRQEVNEATASEMGVTFSIRYRAPRASGAHERAEGESSSNVVTYDGILASAVMEAFQRVLQSLVAALVDRRRGAAALDAQLAPTVGALWLRTARFFTAAMSAYARTTDDVLRVRTVPIARGASFGTLSLTPRLALSICYLGCVQLRLAVLPHDLLAWCRDGTLPYFSAYAALPARLQCVAAAHGSLDAVVRPRRHDTVEQLRKSAVAVAHALAIGAEPLPSRAATLSRICTHLGLAADGDEARTATSLLEAATNGWAKQSIRKGRQRGPFNPRSARRAGTSQLYPKTLALLRQQEGGAGGAGDAGGAGGAGAESVTDTSASEVEDDSGARDLPKGSRPRFLFLDDWREVWRTQLSALIVAIKLHHDLLGPLACSTVDRAANGGWGAIEAHLMGTTLRVPLGTAEARALTHAGLPSLSASSRLDPVPAAVPRSAREGLALSCAQFATYRHFISRHILVADHPRLELQEEATAMGMLADRIDARAHGGTHGGGVQGGGTDGGVNGGGRTGGGTSGGAGSGTGGGAGSGTGGGSSGGATAAGTPTDTSAEDTSSTHPPVPYVLSADSATGMARRPSVVGVCVPEDAPAELPPRYALVLRSAAALLDDSPSAVHASVLRIEAFAFPKAAREFGTSASGIACAHCGDVPPTSELLCAVCDETLAKCSCHEVVPLCTTCDRAGVARRANGDGHDPTHLRARIPLRCLRCDGVFWDSRRPEAPPAEPTDPAAPSSGHGRGAPPRTSLAVSRFGVDPPPGGHSDSENGSNPMTLGHTPACIRAKGPNQTPPARALTPEEHTALSELAGTLDYEYARRQSFATETRVPADLHRGKCPQPRALPGWARCTLPAAAGLPSSVRYAPPTMGGLSFKYKTAPRGVHRADGDVVVQAEVVDDSEAEVEAEVEAEAEEAEEEFVSAAVSHVINDSEAKMRGRARRRGVLESQATWAPNVVVEPYVEQTLAQRAAQLRAMPPSKRPRAPPDPTCAACRGRKTSHTCAVSRNKRSKAQQARFGRSGPGASDPKVWAKKHKQQSEKKRMGRRRSEECSRLEHAGYETVTLPWKNNSGQPELCYRPPGAAKEAPPTHAAPHRLNLPRLPYGCMYRKAALAHLDAQQGAAHAHAGDADDGDGDGYDGGGYDGGGFGDDDGFGDGQVDKEEDDEEEEEEEGMAGEEEAPVVRLRTTLIATSKRVRTAAAAAASSAFVDDVDDMDDMDEDEEPRFYAGRR